MHYLKRAIFGSSASAQPSAESSAEDQTKEAPVEVTIVSEEAMLNQCMPGEMQEEMFCFTMGDCQFSELLPNNQGRQTKKCEFINAGVHIAQMPFSYEGANFQMPCVVITNDDYDADQDQRMEEKLPLAESLIFMRYEAFDDDDDSARVGFVFYYPDLGENGSGYIIEANPEKSQNARDELTQFEQWVCKVLYAINERKPLRTSARNQSVLVEQDKRCARYCIATDLDVLLQQSCIADIFFASDLG